MGFLLLGLVIGIGVGFLLGRRQVSLAPLPGEVASPRSNAPTATVLPPGTPPITKKARRLGLSEVDFVPTDDILTRMQDAWEQSQVLDGGDGEPDDAPGNANDTVTVTAAPEPSLASAPPPEVAASEEIDARPATNPLEQERLRRVLARLEGQQPEGEPAEPRRAVTEAPSTVTEALAMVAAEGYEDDLHLDGGNLTCSSCGASHPADVVEVDRVLRFEGPSDPGDQAIVLALHCPACGAKGALVSAFGPDADPDLAEAFVYLASRARHR